MSCRHEQKATVQFFDDTLASESETVQDCRRLTAISAAFLKASSCGVKINQRENTSWKLRLMCTFFEVAQNVMTSVAYSFFFK